MGNILEEIYKRNQEKIDELQNEIDDINENDFISQFTNSLISCTLAEAQVWGSKPRQMRFITNARKSGEGAGAGTGLPSFYNSATSTWVDFMGNPITV